MGVLIGVLLLAGAVALVVYGMSALKMQQLLLQQPKEKWKAAGLNLENIFVNLVPGPLSKTRKLGSAEIDRLGRTMLISSLTFVAVVVILLVYMLAVSG